MSDSGKNQTRSGFGYIVPEWVSAADHLSVSMTQAVYGHGKDLPATTFILPLKPDKVEAVRAQLLELHPEILLFLSKIKWLNVEKRNVFCWHICIPANKHGHKNFPFIIQADFILASSRESIILDNAWNMGILQCVPSAFVNAFQHCVGQLSLFSSVSQPFELLPAQDSPAPEFNKVWQLLNADDDRYTACINSCNLLLSTLNYLVFWQIMRQSLTRIVLRPYVFLSIPIAKGVLPCVQFLKLQKNSRFDMLWTWSFTQGSAKCNMEFGCPDNVYFLPNSTLEAVLNHQKDVALGIPSHELSSEQAFMLLDWIRLLRTMNSSVPKKFIESIKNGKWMKTLSGYKSPREAVLPNETGKAIFDMMKHVLRARESLIIYVEDDCRSGLLALRRRGKEGLAWVTGSSTTAVSNPSWARLLGCSRDEGAAVQWWRR
ncbi:hypothetical protein M0R45_020123 [Rubus argutus]|uniref:Uncharacterized protein n=1 Tax=Rubus argutus TaxID=59490 RepID=A0AAW1X893_RUBAR